MRRQFDLVRGRAEDADDTSVEEQSPKIEGGSEDEFYVRPNVMRRHRPSAQGAKRLRMESLSHLGECQGSVRRLVRSRSRSRDRE